MKNNDTHCVIYGGCSCYVAVLSPCEQKNYMFQGMIGAEGTVMSLQQQPLRFPASAIVLCCWRGLQTRFTNKG